MERYSFVVLTNAVEGRDADFNAWYDDRHVPDILDLPGVVSAQRFVISDAERSAAPYRYLAIYEVETADLAQTVATLKAREGTEAMPVSDALKPGLLAGFFKPITEKRR